jgi:hypothetical protein
VAWDEERQWILRQRVGDSARGQGIAAPLRKFAVGADVTEGNGGIEHKYLLLKITKVDQTLSKK